MKPLSVYTPSKALQGTEQERLLAHAQPAPWSTHHARTTCATSFRAASAACLASRYALSACLRAILSSQLLLSTPRSVPARCAGCFHARPDTCARRGGGGRNYGVSLSKA